MHNWEKRQAKEFLSKRCGIDLSLITVGKIRGRRLTPFLVQTSDRLLAEWIAKRVYDCGGELIQCWHAKKTSWVKFLIPAQAVAWNRHTFIRKANFWPSFRGHK